MIYVDQKTSNSSKEKRLCFNQNFNLKLIYSGRSWPLPKEVKRDGETTDKKALIDPPRVPLEERMS